MIEVNNLKCMNTAFDYRDAIALFFLLFTEYSNSG